MRWPPAATIGYWRKDLELVRRLGIRYLRYGPPLHLTNPHRGRYDWDFLDEVAAEMRRLGIVPIMDLCHFGLPNWLENFQNPETPQALADYARAFAQRYDWVRFYTPVNEMYVCAKLSALLGLWNEQAHDEHAFVTAVRHLAKANVLMMRAIATERPDAIFVNSESGEFFQSCCPDPNLCKIADFENQRRFLALDLLYAHPVREDMRDYLFEHGMPPEEYAWFMRQDVGKRAILGVDYYEWNEKLVDSEGHIQALGELFGWHVIVDQYYRRYRRPMMHTETNCLDARDAPRWLWRQWHNVQLMRRSGVPIVGFTWYSLTDQVDWDIALREPLGNVNPVGLFDLNRDPRPVGQAYRYLISLFSQELSEAPPIETVIDDCRRRNTQTRGGVMLSMLRAHGLDAGPTQRPALDRPFCEPARRHSGDRDVACIRHARRLGECGQRLDRFWRRWPLSPSCCSAACSMAGCFGEPPTTRAAAGSSVSRSGTCCGCWRRRRCCNGSLSNRS